MKTVYYSEQTGKYYDTEKECHKAETELAIQKREEEQTKNSISKHKKELADKIELADSKVSEAYKHLEVCRQDAKKILDDAKKQAEGIIAGAKEELRKCQKEKYDTLAEFNKEFGPYTTTYSGSKALDEIRVANSLFTDLFDFFF